MGRASAVCAFMLIGSFAVRAQQVTFQPPVSFTPQNGPLSITSADFNGDGYQDLAIANARAATISSVLSNGDGTFQTPAISPLPEGCASNYVYAGDFNNDGHPDILALCFGTQLLVVLPGKGDGTFSAAVTVTLPLVPFTGDLLEGGNLQPAIADFDGDGNLDIILPLGTPDSSNVPGAYLLRGLGNCNFQAATPVQGLPSSETGSLATADFNGDGHPDLAILEISPKPTTVSLLIALGLGDGSFRVSNTYPSSAGFSIRTADVNGDGNADIVISGGIIGSGSNSTLTASALVFTGNGGGGFTLASTVPFGSTQGIVYDLAIADIRGSRKPDLIAILWTDVVQGLAGESTSLMIAPSNGDGTFQTPIDQADLGSTAVFSIAAGDFNGDGRSDLAMVSAPASSLSGLSFKGGSAVLGEILASLQTLPTGNGEVLINTTPPLSFTDTNDASFKAGSQAQDAILAAFGGGLSSTIASPPGLPTDTLGGVNVNVKDSAGVTRAAPLFYVSPKQVNYTIPDGTALGAATISIVNGATAAVATQQIVAAAPGIFAVNGIAAANVATYVTGASAPTVMNAFQVGSGGAITLAPIVLDPNAQVFLFMYGTGIRHATTVTANLGSLKNQPVEYAGSQGFYVGEDQINVLLPQSLKGAGVINVTLTADGLTTNTVQIEIQ